MSAHPHRRYNSLSGEWIVVSSQRTQRPWHGNSEQASSTLKGEAIPVYDPQCYLCPRNLRSPRGGKGAGKVEGKGKESGESKGERNPDYKDVYVFDNDFPALLSSDSPALLDDVGTITDITADNIAIPNIKISNIDPPRGSKNKNNDFFIRSKVKGVCRVICYSPKHNVHLANMTTTEIGKIISQWAAQSEELGKIYSYVQIFENKGAMVGCSNPHPHGQIWATDYIPNIVAAEHLQQDNYYKSHGRALLSDYLEAEEKQDERIVLRNEHWTVLIPYWAYWPYETLLLPRRSFLQLTDIDDEASVALAEIFKELTNKYDRLFNRIFPYMMGWHGGCNKQSVSEGRLLHCHFYPPLLDNIKRKYMAGFEVFAEAQRDISPEQAAQHLREV